MKQANDTTKKQAQIKESASALGWGQKKEKLKKSIQWVVEGIIFSDSSCSKVHKGLHISGSDVGGCERGTKEFEQHIAEIIWYRAKTKSAPKLEIKKNPGVEKGRCPILEFQMQNGEQLGTNPPPSLAKKKRKRVRLQKKLPKAKPISAKKNC